MNHRCDVRVGQSHDYIYNKYIIKDCITIGFCI